VGVSTGAYNLFKLTPKNYVPAGTFARVVLLEGADANASVNAQSDTSGILVRVLDHGTLPNGHRNHLKGCFILASIYGDISSERGEARLTKISCTRHDGSIFEKKVQGYLSFAGKEGIKGTPVMRNGKILAMAGISGMLSGVGSALQTAAQTQTVSPLGTTSVINSNQVMQNAGFGGAATAMDHLAGYYVKSADQYHPIIEIGSGTVATVIFQSGFSLLDKEQEKRLREHKRHHEETHRGSASVNLDSVTKSSADEVKRLLKQAQKISQPSNGSPFSNAN
jgi:conjugal transfer pilus assembly protein TraB